MERREVYKNKEDLISLCMAVKELIGTQDYQKCETLIFDAMGRYPHAPEPHNLFGILLEKTGEHIAAMKHFRAAWALDPTYLPARQNLEWPSLFSILAGSIVCLVGKKEASTFEWRSSMERSSITVLFAWAWGVLVGAMPFILSGQLTFVQALFESVSGWTTTGLSVMDVSATPHIFLFHRSFMQFCGGLGFVMMIVMLVQDKQSMNLYNAEGHPDKLMPNLKKTARTICLMYNGFLFAGILAYVIVGMSLFDAVNHTMCALSTGGFSTRLNSIGEYKSFSIDIITVILMLIGTTNFAVLALLTKRKWRQVIRVSEVKFMFLLVLVFVPITAFSLMSGLNMSI